MQLTEAEVRQFDEAGYLFLPNRFSEAEVAVLRGAVPGIFAQERD